MAKRLVGGVLRVGRAAVSVVGLAVVLALVLGGATTALAGTGVGATFNLGKVNSVSALSTLVGGTASSMLKVDNNGAGTALDLQVGPSTTPPEQKTAAPMKVDSQAKVANLNADEIDGKDSSEFASGVNGKATDADQLDGRDSSEFATDGELDAKTADVWGYVRANGELITNPSANILQVTHPVTGEYCVVTSIDYNTYLSPQVTLAEPGSTKIASVGTGYGSSCNPLYSDTQTPIPVYIRTPGGNAADAEFSVFVPAPN